MRCNPFMYYAAGLEYPQLLLSVHSLQWIYIPTHGTFSQMAR